MRIEALVLVASLACLTACDRRGSSEVRSERSDSNYRAAMEDYAAGRMDAAIKGLEKAVKAHPDNSSARFQLACLLQDVRKDYLQAFCAYHEYLLQTGNGDKASVARERMKACEKDMALELAQKHGISDGGASVRELTETRNQVKELKRKLEAKDVVVTELRDQLESQKSAHQRMVAALKGSGESEGKTSDIAEKVKDDKDLLDEEDAAGDRFARVDEIAKLRSEEQDEISAGSSLLPARKEDDKENRRKAEEERKAAKEREKNAAPSHPPTYVIQEGDTLYRIAMRFYGTMHAWKKIREANKAIISSDGRLRAGDTITLP